MAVQCQWVLLLQCGNKPAKIKNLHQHVSWNHLAREEKACFFKKNKKTKKHCITTLYFIDILKILLKFHTNLSWKLGQKWIGTMQNVWRCKVGFVLWWWWLNRASVKERPLLSYHHISWPTQQILFSYLFFNLLWSGVNKWQNTAATPVLITSCLYNRPQTGNETDLSY